MRKNMKNFGRLDCFLYRKQIYVRRISMKIPFKKAAAVFAASVMLGTCPMSAEAVTLQTDNGIKYISCDNGDTKPYTGWSTMSGKKYYYKNGIMKKSCWLTVGGKRTYFLRKDGSLATGKVTISGREYDFGEDGRLILDMKISVNGSVLKLDASAAPYEEGDTLMLPICPTAEALGYKVSLDEDSGTVTVDDEYIQKVTLTDGSDTAVFEGRLKVINMSRETTLSKPVKIFGGQAYAPAELFEEFFNDVITQGDTVYISPSTVELE